MIPPRHIFLVGISGSGKTTVGKVLAKKLGRPFVDIDRLIVRKARKSITKFFRDEGEAAFRKLESSAIKEITLQSRRPKIVALGAGAFEKGRTRKLVANSGISVWLRCSIGELHNRLVDKTDRPLLHNYERQNDPKSGQLKKRLLYLLSRRQKNYRKADLQVSTAHKTPSLVTSELIRKIKNKYVSN